MTNTTTTLKTTRFCTGCYQTTDGRWEVRSASFDSEGESRERAWLLFDRTREEDGGYAGHYTTKSAALEWAATYAAEEREEA